MALIIYRPPLRDGPFTLGDPMLKTWFAPLSALLMLLCLTCRVQAADQPTTVQEDEKLPAADALKVNAGTAEGRKTPTEVVASAIKAAKDGKMDVLKGLWTKDNQQYLDNDSYYKGQDIKCIDAVAVVLASFDTGKLKEFAQNTIGNYAIVMHNTEASGMRLIRTVYEKKNWCLRDYWIDDYLRDYGAGLKETREAIDAGGAKLKARLDSYETDTLDLLSGVQEGVDPYDILGKRLKKATTSDGPPRLFLNAWGSELAYWFTNSKAGEKESKDNFIVLRSDVRYDWQEKSYSTDSKIVIGSTAQFAKRPGGKFKEWVNDYKPWGDEEEEKEGKDEKDGGGK